MPRLNDPTFWQPYLPQLRREFVDLVMDILMAGGDAGAKGIPLLSVFVDWDVFNQDALDWLDMYLGLGGALPPPGGAGSGGFAWAWALVDATRRGVAREIDRWIRAGAPLPELERRLLPFFDRKRAHRVAVTEVTRVYASGNILAWKASGVVGGKRWMTAVDEHVCPVCGRMHNTFVDLDRGWEFTAEALAADPALARAVRAPMTIIAPPAHVNCRCWVLPVVYEALTPEETAAGRFDPMRRGGGATVGGERAIVVQGGPDALAKALADVEPQIAKLKDYEVAYVFDRDGRFLLQKKGNAHSVSFTEEEMRGWAGGTLTHNHPGGSSLSDADIILFADRQLRSIRAVGTRDGRRVTYELSVIDEMFYANRHLTESAYRRAEAGVLGRMWPQIDSGAITIDEANALHPHLVAEQFVADMNAAMGRPALRYTRTHEE